MKEEIIVTKNLTTEIAKAIVEKASTFEEASIHILYDNKRVNAKSIMGVLSLSLKVGETAIIEVIDEEAESIIEILSALI